MELVSMRMNCMGTISFMLKLGKMKKAEEFVTYPIQKDDSPLHVYLQSGHRWAILNTKTGEVELSARRAQYADSIWLVVCRARGTNEFDRATPEQLSSMLDVIRATASPHAGGNNILSMYCDNSNAALV